jgi:hypothetical protein
MRGLRVGYKGGCRAFLRKTADHLRFYKIGPSERSVAESKDLRLYFFIYAFNIYPTGVASANVSAVSGTNFPIRAS